MHKLLFEIVGMCFLIYSPLFSQKKTDKDYPQLIPYLGHTSEITCIKVSADGSLMLTGDTDGRIILRELIGGTSLREFIKHKSNISGLAFDSTENLFYSASSDGLLCKWDARSGKLMKSLELKCPLYSLAIFKNGLNALCYTSFGTVFIDLEKFKRISTLGGLERIERYKPLQWLFKTSPFIAASYVINDDKDIVYYNYVWIVTRDIYTNKIHNKIKNKINFVDLKPLKNGERILSADAAGNIVLWNNKSGDTIRIFKGHKGKILSVAVNQDGSLFASSSDSSELFIWHIDDTLPKPLKANFPNIKNLTFHPENNSLIGTNYSRIYIWDTKTGLLANALQTGDISKGSDFYFDYPYSSSASPDGRYVCSGSLLGNLTIWDLKKGVAFDALNTGKSITDFYWSNDNNIISMLSRDNKIRTWNIEKNIQISALRFNRKFPNSVDVSSKSGLVAFTTADSIVLMKVMYGTSGFVKIINQFDFLDANFADLLIDDFSHKIYCSVNDSRILQWNIKTGRIKLKRLSEKIIGIDFTRDGKYVMTCTSEGDIYIYDSKKFKRIKKVQLDNTILVMKYYPDNNSVYVNTGDENIYQFSVPYGELINTIKGFQKPLKSIDILNNGKQILGTDHDGEIGLWDIEKNQMSVRFKSVGKSIWFVYDEKGRFDTNAIESLDDVNWIYPDEPMKSYPLVLYQRNYFEPGLLRRYMNNETLPEIESVIDIDRTIPNVEMTLASTQLNVDTVDIMVKIGYSDSIKDYFYDLHILRNESLVIRYPYDEDINKRDITDDIDQWRNSTKIPVDPETGNFEKSFKIRIPSNRMKDTILFSAYAYNKDRVKSKSTGIIIYVSNNKEELQESMVHLINIGVSGNISSSYQLPYASYDAEMLGNGFKFNDNYKDVIQIPLIAGTPGQFDDYQKTKHILPTKSNIHSVFYRLTCNDDIITNPKLAAIKQVNPNDLVIITFSGHGMVSTDQTFYLVPFDANEEEIDNGNFSSLISSNELAEWLRPVDASRIILIIDACYSASAIESGNFKPAPFGNKGLGQLAYDKGISVLVATQKDSTAMELGYGMLTYALIKKGIMEKAAFGSNDSINLIDFLRFAEINTPVFMKEKNIEFLQEPKFYLFQKSTSQYTKPVYIYAK